MSMHESRPGYTPTQTVPQGRTPQVRTIDVSQVGNSIQALRVVEDYLAANVNRGDTVDIRIGQLLLTRGILSKIAMLLRKYAVSPGTVYSGVPQTQQAALDEGFSVREKPASASPVSFEVGRSPVSFTGDNVDLPGFGAPQKRVPQPQKAPDYTSGPQLPGAQYGSVPSSEDVSRASQRLLDILPPAPQEPPITQAEEHARAQVQYQQEHYHDEDEILAEARRVAASFGVELPQRTESDVVTEYIPQVAVEDLVQAFDHELAAEESPTLFLKQTLRSGQVVRFNGSIVVIGDAHAGSEIAASGDIVVWGELRGIAHAGVGGNDSAEIRAMKIDALQLRIGDVIARRPDRISYHKPTTSAVLAPELAKVQDGEIRIFQESV